MKHTKEEWKEIVKEFEKSGQSQRVWSKENGEDRNRLCYWVIRFRELSEVKNVTFAEILVGGADEWY
jgi:hypothetical protein